MAERSSNRVRWRVAAGCVAGALGLAACRAIIGYEDGVAAAADAGTAPGPGMATGDGAADAPPPNGDATTTDEGGDPFHPDCFDAGAGAGDPISCSGGGSSTCGPDRTASCCDSTWVPGGIFRVGNDVTTGAVVCGFRLDAYEVTVGRFRRFVAAYDDLRLEAGAGRNPNNGADPGWQADFKAPADRQALVAALACGAPSERTWTDAPGPNESLPINCVDWYVAYAFCIWDHGRLPTQAEWSFAAVGGTEQRIYPWGDAAAGPARARYACNYPGDGGGCQLAPAGSLDAGVAKWGQFDVAGNVWEWNVDHHIPLSGPCFNCSSLNGDRRVIAGGGFNYADTALVNHPATSDYPSTQLTSYGIRCARP